MMIIKSLRIISNKVDLWAFKIPLGIVEYTEGYCIDIDLLYLPSILQVCPDILDNFKNGAGEFYLVTLSEEGNEEMNRLEYEMESIPNVTTEEKCIYNTTINYVRAEQQLLEFSEKLSEGSKWNPLLGTAPQIFEIFSIMYFVGYLKQIPLSLLGKGKDYKECQEIQNP